MTDALLLLSIGISLWTTGQIWFAQAVVYPLFHHVVISDYIDYHRFYAKRILLPVIFPGFACFVMSAPLAIFGSDVPAWLHIANIGLGLIGLLVTVDLAFPNHTKLENSGKDPAVIAELISHNWLRTISTTMQAIVSMGMLGHVQANL
jgi:hypothetical protein